MCIIKIAVGIQQQGTSSSAVVQCSACSSAVVQCSASSSAVG